MAIGDVSDDDLTPPGWWSFVQPQTSAPDAPVVDPAPVADAPTPETALPPPQPGVQFQEADTVQPAIPPVNGIAATDQTPPPPPPMVDAALGAAQKLGGAVNAALPGEGPIAGTSIEPMSPMLAPNETAASPDYIDHQVANAGPLPSAQNAAGDKAIDERAQYLATHPYEAAKDQVMRQHAQQAEFNAEQYRLAKENEAKAQAEWDAHQRARLKSEQDFQDMNAKAAALANTKIDPKLHPGLAQGILNVLAAAVGGAMSKSTGGRNLALEQLNKAIDDNIDAQKANLANQYHSLGMQREGLQMRAQREAEDYRDQTAFRIGMYQQAMSALQTRMQDFDPRGSQAAQIAQNYVQIASAAQKTALDYKAKAFDQAVKIDKSQQEWYGLQQKDQEMADKRAEWLAKHGGGVGAGAGGATNPDFTVATGFFDPFTQEPIFGKREIGGKGKEKERETAYAQINTYPHVQDYWDKLNKIGEKIDGAKKGWSESVWKARRGTLEKEYDQAREALTVYLTKELGDKLTQGQLEAQAHRIPERASVFDAADPMKLIRDAQEDADRDFMRDMNEIGVNAAPIIQHARDMRAARPQPAPLDAISSAQDAVARTAPGSAARRDAQAALDEAKDRHATELAQEREGKAAIDAATSLEPVPMTAVASEGIRGLARSAIDARNEAAHSYNKKLVEFRQLQADAGKSMSSGKPESPATVAKRDRDMRAAAIDVMRAREVLDAENAPKGHTSKLELVPGLLDTPVAAPPVAPAVPTQLQPGAESLFPPSGPRSDR